MKTQLLCVALQAVFISTVFSQGSLTPPGAPSATMKTLEQVEPRVDLATVAGNAEYHHVISQPGSYYLSVNLVVTTTNGISVNVSDVTLDLNGFEVFRSSGSGGNGIMINGGVNRVSVMNGSIRGFKYGINSYTTPLPTPEGCYFSRLSVSECSFYGIFAGMSSRVVDCVVHDNDAFGINVYPGSTIQRCVAKDNGSNGISVGDFSSAIGCSAYNNEGIGIDAYSACTLENCVAYNNNGIAGINAYSGCTLIGCTSQINEGIGFRTLNGVTLNSCTALSNQGLAGIYALDSCIVNDCIASFNANAGIHAGNQSHLISCVAKSNSGPSAIEVMDQCLVSECNSSGNSGVGFSAGARCKIVTCLSSSNGQGGIVAGDGTSIRECTASGNSGPYGISTGDDSTVQHCRAEDNSGSGASSYGIYVGNNCTVLNCIANQNTNVNDPSSNLQGVGIYTGIKSVVQCCKAILNIGDGINVGYGSDVRECVCIGNGLRSDNSRNGAGVHARGYDGVVEDNTVRYNDYGIHVEGVKNLVVKNRARNNATNFFIVTGNYVGTIAIPSASGAISGDSGASGVNTTDPYANIKQ